MKKFLGGYLYFLLLLIFLLLMFIEDLRVWAVFMVGMFVYLAYLIHTANDWERKYIEADKQSQKWEEKYFRVMKPHKSKFGTSKADFDLMLENGNGEVTKMKLINGKFEVIADQPDVPPAHFVRGNQ